MNSQYGGVGVGPRPAAVARPDPRIIEG